MVGLFGKTTKNRLPTTTTKKSKKGLFQLGRSSKNAIHKRTRNKLEFKSIASPSHDGE